jgi:hypothetical protein
MDIAWQMGGTRMSGPEIKSEDLIHDQHKSPALSAHCLKTCASQRAEASATKKGGGTKRPGRGQKRPARGTEEARKRKGRGQEEEGKS